MREVVITQHQYNALLNEAVSMLPERVKQIVAALDSNFMVNRDKNSQDYGAVYRIDSSGRAIAKVDDVEVFYKLQGLCQTIADKATRDSLLKKVIKDWYAGSIKGSLMSVAL
jgi:hypothetical protein